MKNYVIVGGVAGGATAAARLRRRDEDAHIVIIERGPHVSFANCGLPYHIGEVITERDDLFVSTPKDLHDKLNIDVRTRQEVVAIDRQAKEVEIRDLKEERLYTLSYDKLLLSPGARPFVPPIPGVDAGGVFTLRNVADMDRIKRRIDAEEIGDAIIVGGGFIGLEMADNLAQRGLQVTVVEMLDQVMSSLDYEMAAILHHHLREQGIRLELGDALVAIEAGTEKQLKVFLASSRTMETDLVILALGVRPESGLAEDAGLDLGKKGHIVVNEFMQTSDRDIYAVGDAVQVTDPVTGTVTAVPLAGPANRQARIAANHITGLTESYRGTMGTCIAKVFELTASCTGANSHKLEQNGIDFVSSITRSQNHVSYYPGARPQTIKLLYSPHSGELLGAQVVGHEGVDRTIDVLATALTAEMTVFDLEHLELAYAPPYGAAKDPVNIAGYVASNRLRGDTDLIQWHEIEDLDPETQGVLDVRTDVERSLGYIPGSAHIPQTELRERLDELSRDKEWIVYCAVGQRAYVVERILKQNGYRVKNLTGGWEIYSIATEEQSNLNTEHERDVEEMTSEDTVMIPALAREDQKAPVFSTANAIDLELDTCGLQCPGPIMKVYNEMREMERGQVLRVRATDPGFRRDVRAWCEQTGNTLLDLEKNNGHTIALLQKGEAVPLQVTESGTLPKGKTVVVFSADLDRALAAFVIANGAAAMGQKVTMFFTFWGLNVLRRKERIPTQKNIVEKMFGWMLPKGPDALKLSRLNMGGLGTEMMKRVMKAKNVDSLSQLLAAAQENGIKLVACQMSMDMMGIKEEELIDDVEVGGVATYIGETDKSNASLFI